MHQHDNVPEPCHPPLVFDWALQLRRVALASAVRAQSQGLVSVRFLGPSQAQVGELVTLAWQVTRLRQPSMGGSGLTGGSQSIDAGGDEVVAFEIAQPSLPHGLLVTEKSWSLGVSGRGALRLGLQPGSLGMVEVGVAPSVPGLLPPPVLIFQGLESACCDSTPPIVDVALVLP